MEKISHIVRGSSRVASVDMKGSPAVRPGAPSYGRPMGESPHPHPGERMESTAARASALQNELAEKRTGENPAVEALADQFFMTRIRRPETQEGHPGSAETPITHKGTVSVASEHARKMAAPDKMEDEEELGTEAREAQVEPTPTGFTPRGTYVDVHA